MYHRTRSAHHASAHHKEWAPQGVRTTQVRTRSLLVIRTLISSCDLHLPCSHAPCGCMRVPPTRLAQRVHIGQCICLVCLALAGVMEDEDEGEKMSHRLQLREQGPHTSPDLPCRQTQAQVQAGPQQQDRQQQGADGSSAEPPTSNPQCCVIQ